MREVTGITAGAFALRLHTLRGTAVYAAYLVDTAELEVALTDLADELRALMPDGAVIVSSPRDGDQLVAEIAATSIEVVIVDARSFSSQDWAFLDRRRSSLARPDTPSVLVLVTTPVSFAELMHVAPNLASWLGGEVFSYPRNESSAAAHREQRLVALRAWASRTDEELIEAARARKLPPDPEYAEWLVLLGHGELLPPGAP